MKIRKKCINRLIKSYNFKAGFHKRRKHKRLMHSDN